MTDTVSKQTTYAVMLTTGAAVAKQTAYVVMLSPVESVSKQTAYVVMFPSGAEGGGRRRQMIVT